MKQLTTMLLTLFFVFALASCNDSNEGTSEATPELLNTSEAQEEEEEEEEIDNYDEGEVIEGEIDENDATNEFDDFNELDEKEELLQLPGDDAYEPFPTD